MSDNSPLLVLCTLIFASLITGCCPSKDGATMSDEIAKDTISVGTDLASKESDPKPSLIPLPSAELVEWEISVVDDSYGPNWKSFTSPVGRVSILWSEGGSIGEDGRPIFDGVEKSTIETHSELGFVEREVFENRQVAIAQYLLIKNELMKKLHDSEWDFFGESDTHYFDGVGWTKWPVRRPRNPK